MKKQPHLRCTKKDINKFCLLPGDPARADRVADQLSDSKHIGFNREYNIHSGNYDGVPVTVCSTGIGGSSTAIAIHELVNCGAKVLIRVGSSGALQKKMKLGDLIIPEGAVRSESTSDLYFPREHPAMPDKSVFDSLKSSAKGVKHHVGFTNSHDGFYHKDSDEMDSFWSRIGLIGADFETAPLFVIAEYLGVKAGSILNVVSTFGGSDAESVASYATGESRTMRGERNSIMVALKAIKKLSEKKNG